jgi:hypothetical protein
MDPLIVFFAMFFAIVGASALISHAVIRGYARAIVVSAVASSAGSYVAFGLWVGRVPPWAFFATLTIIAAVVSAGIGIPFRRSRTGRGLGPRYMDHLDF